MTLNESIRQLRRKRSMTQEQLAEAMNVSAAAVSKWENGQSVPDIAVLTALADYFEISLDALVGYTVQSHRREDMVAHIQKLHRHKQYAQALEEADEALRRYPNHFSVVHAAARVWGSHGVEHGDHASLQRAVELTGRAMALMGQNEDPSLRVENLWTALGMYHAGLGDREKAISCYEAGNISGLNDVAIASNRVSLGQYEEALPALSHGIVRGMAQLFNAGSGALRCLMAGGELQEADALCRWLIRMLEGMEAGEGSYVYKMRAVLCARHAAILLAQGDEDAARQRLELAMESARRFDAAPDFALQSIRFYHGEDKAMTDGMGETAMDALGRIIDQSGALSERLRALLPG